MAVAPALARDLEAMTGLIRPYGLPAQIVCPQNAEAAVLVALAGWPANRVGRVEQLLSSLHEAGLATIRFDFFTEAEAADRTLAYDTRLMGERLQAARNFAREHAELADLPLCLLGFSTGAAAALQFAIMPNAEVAAIAGCGGRPDLARDALPRIRVPTLLITGDRDEAVLDFNRAALARLSCEKKLHEIQGAGPYLETAGALYEAGEAISEWFLKAARALPKKDTAAAMAAPEIFTDRSEAGRLLSLRLLKYTRQSPVVLALPRGGVPVGLEIARALDAPLDVVISRKIGVPWEPELAVAAIAEGAPPEIVLNEKVLRAAAMSQDDIARLARLELDEVVRRQALYRRGRAPLAIEGATVVVVDDGLVTGATMRAALRALVLRKPARLVLALPVAAPEELDALRGEVDEIVCLQSPRNFRAVGQSYRDFSPVADETVTAILAAAARTQAGRHTQNV